MKKFIGMLKNWKTTILGFLPFLIAILNQFNIVDFTPDAGVETVNAFFDQLVLFLGTVIGFIGLFARDSDKSSEESSAD